MSSKAKALVRIKTDEQRLAVVDQARAMLAHARSAVDAKKVADMAKAAEVYGKLQGVSKEAIAEATAIMVDALALMGEFLKKAEKNKGTAGKGRPRIGGSRMEPPNHQVPASTLAESGIPKKQSMHAQALATVKEKNPELYEKVRSGKASVASAHVENKRQEKREQLVKNAKATPSASAKLPEWNIIQGEVGIGEKCPLLDIECDSVRLIFADPPYNIGFDYGEGHDDKQSDVAYLAWCRTWINQCADLLTPDGSFWVLINDEYAAEYNLLLKSAGLFIRNWIIWYESFGVNCSDKFNRTKRHLFYAVRDPENCVFHFDAVSRPSDRQTKYQDARANPSGKVLDDVWFDIPRLVGTATGASPTFPRSYRSRYFAALSAARLIPETLCLTPSAGPPRLALPLLFWADGLPGSNDLPNSPKTPAIE